MLFMKDTYRYFSIYWRVRLSVSTCAHAEAVSSTGVWSAPIVPPCIHSDLRRSSCWNSRVHFVTGIVILAKDKTVFELLPKQLVVSPFESNNNTHWLTRWLRAMQVSKMSQDDKCVFVIIQTQLEIADQ